MGVFDRLKNVAKGTMSNAVGDLERANPEAVYEAAVENTLARIARHKDAVASLAVQRNELAETIEALEREAAQVQQALAGALAEDDDDTALVLVARKDEIVRAIEDKRREHDQVEAAVEETKQSLKALRQEAKALEREKAGALAQLHAAEASIEIHEANSGLGTSASAKGLDSVRSSINVLNAQANEGYLDEEGNSIRGRADALGRKAAEASARAELERLKRLHRGEAPAAPEDSAGDEEVEAPPAEKKRDL